MKKIILTLFISISFYANAQLTAYHHAPAVGDINYSTYQCDSTLITVGSGGAGQVWNYNISNLNSLKNYTVSASLNAAYNPADVQVTSGTDNTLYYKSNTNKLEYYGGDLSLNGVKMNVKYASPAVFAIYPMSLNTTTTSLTSGTVNITSPITTTQAFSGTCTVLADATGTLTLPAKTFTNVIRVVTTQTLVASVASVKLQYYDYYSIGSAAKAAVLSVQNSTVTSLAGTNIQTITFVEKDYELVGIKETQKPSIELSVFPNPASNFVNFTTTSTEVAKIITFDVTGKIVATETMEMGKVKLNVNNLSSGVYMYHAVDKNNQVLSTGKFNVNK
ncbi:MAG: T9SS type A sorting domain-containing protein [Bacteroidetes bacterium]|nr:T9SS type A sorting domain-containing protein [Bacteroidota bacterium]